MYKHLFVVAIVLTSVLRIWGSQGPLLQSINGLHPPVQSNSTIAFINSTTFPERIIELKKETERLKVEFTPTLREIAGLDASIDKLEEELEVKGDTLNQITIKQKLESLHLLKRKLSRKREDYEYESNKRTEEVLGPPRDKILKSLKNYAAAHNITVVFDLPVIMQSGLIYADAAKDITEDFIKQYNQENPGQP
ncbi:MAG: OmpH family outer membrane protein [Acidobacteriota bacterium]